MVWARSTVEHLCFLLSAISNEKQRHTTHIIVISPTCSIFSCIWKKNHYYDSQGKLDNFVCAIYRLEQRRTAIVMPPVECYIGQQWKTNEWVIHFSKNNNCEMWARGLACGECFHSFSFIIQGPEWPITIRFARSWNAAYFFFCFVYHENDIHIVVIYTKS